MTKIFIHGLTALGKIGVYERQLGNVAILIPTIKMLKKYIPDADISTTIQLTDKFCMTHGINRMSYPKRPFPHFIALQSLLISFFDLFRAILWRFIRDLLHIEFKVLITGKKLEIFSNSDVILDFNGDIFPSDTHPIRVLSHALEILTIRLLKIPVIEFASSPGPFDTWFKKFISKLVFNNTNIIINREPLSSELLKQIGINKTPIINAACPAFLLESVSKERIKEIFLHENINQKDKPLIGVTLAGYNLYSYRTWDIPPSFKDLSSYAPVLKYLLDDLKAYVILVPHVYRTNPWTGEHIHGPDYVILQHLYQEVDGDKYKGRLRLIEGIYNVTEIKGIIGECDMFISGRLHAGIAALSQAVPTVLLAYGHKHYGIARLLNQEKYVCDGKDVEVTISIVKDAWKNREKIKRVLKKRLARVKELSELNFKIVKEVIGLNKEERNNIPKEKSTIWIKMGE